MLVEWELGPFQVTFDRQSPSMTALYYVRSVIVASK
jgi:hypothetical protein